MQTRLRAQRSTSELSAIPSAQVILKWIWPELVRDIVKPGSSCGLVVQMHNLSTMGYKFEPHKQIDGGNWKGIQS